MDCRWVEDIDKFRDISGEWDKAVVDSGDHNPFLLSNFIITWWKHFGKGKGLRIFVVYDGDRISGGIPFYLERKGLAPLSAGILYYVGGSVANYTEPLYSGGKTELLPILARSLASRTDWDVLSLTDLREGNRFISEVNAFGSKMRFRRYVINDHMNFAIDLSDGLDRYISSISPKLRRDLKAKRKHISNKFGEITLKEVRGEEEVNRCVDLYRKFSLDAFAARNRRSNFNNERYAEFFREFLVLMERDGRLDAHMLIAGDNVLAISFAYRFGRGFNWVLTGFNYEYKYYRPGYILIEELLKEVARRKESYYNWYGYGRFYKDQWCNLQTPLYKVLIVKKTLKGSLFLISQKVRKTAKSLRDLLKK